MIKIEVKTDDLQRKFRKLASNIRDLDQANREVSIQLYSFTMRNFDQEGGLVEAGGWEELAPYTKKWKADRGYSKILQNTGALRGSFLPFYDRNQAGVGAKRYSATGKNKDAPYDLAKIHQEGIGLPKREMLPRYAQALDMGIRVYDWHIKNAREKAQV